MCQTCKLKPIFQRESKVIIGSYNCKQWNCPECGPKRAAMWSRRVDILSGLDDAFEMTRCATRLEEKALIARLHREGIAFIKFRTQTGTVFLHQAFRGNRLMEPNRSAWFGKETLASHAERFLGELVHEPGVRAITCSAELRPEPADSEKSGWTHRGYAPHNLALVNKKLVEAGETRIFPGRVFEARILSLFQVKPRESSSGVSKTKDQDRPRTTTASIAPAKTAIM